MTTRTTVFETIHVLLQAEAGPGREGQFFDDLNALAAAGLAVSTVGTPTPETSGIPLTLMLAVDADPGILDAIQGHPGVFGRAAINQIHAAIEAHIRATGTRLTIRVEHSLLAPAPSSPAMPWSMQAVPVHA